jgi:hypothetical protein
MSSICSREAEGIKRWPPTRYVNVKVDGKRGSVVAVGRHD